NWLKIEDTADTRAGLNRRDGARIKGARLLRVAPPAPRESAQQVVKPWQEKRPYLSVLSKRRGGGETRRCLGGIEDVCSVAARHRRAQKIADTLSVRISAGVDEIAQIAIGIPLPNRHVRICAS